MMQKLTDVLTDEEIDAWIEALESGDYKQCQGSLKRDDSYCCLGVLGMALKGKVQDESINVSPSETFFVPWDAYYIMGPGGGSLNTVFWNMNDEMGLSFVQIAQKIREMRDEEDI